MDNLEEMHKFLDRYNLPRLNQEKIETMNRPSTSNELATLIENRPTNKSPGLVVSQVNSIQHGEKT